MVISPDRKDFFAVFHIIGRLSLFLSLCMVIPLGVAFFFKESSPFYDYLIGILVTASVGFLLSIVFPLKKEVGWQHSFFIVSLGWLVASLLGAVPFFLSHHWLSFLDAWFESMSGFATTGLVLVQDLDHLAHSHNVWRHLTMFLGGQGIILATISLVRSAGSANIGLYVSEGRQEKIFPNVIATARFIWQVSFVYMILGTTALTVVLYSQGIELSKSIVHAFCLFMAAFDTGGFAPQAQNIAYYHSFSIEILTLILMILGAMNFNLHFWVWNKDKREIFKNFEVKIFLFTILIFTIVLYWAMQGNPAVRMFRKGFYQLISAHTGCGFTNLAYGELDREQPIMAAILIMAMGIGGGMCSTTGGIKLLRLGFIFKAVVGEIKKAVMPFKAIYKERYHHLKDSVIEERYIKEAFIITTFYVFTYMLGGLLGLGQGSVIHSFFESFSAAANVGLSVGITNPGMPTYLKLTYIVQMWMGRLEFLSIFIALGYVFSLFKK
ncbi:MAG: TrkH family potassium uptake protein [Candidatus Omnitrophica bacterium]|nr:TrkH family potassium uptake protein [Candidatus Omnitrophota bacterium]